jgi:hypothetical protein
MTRLSIPARWTVVFYLTLITVSIPHLIDDFLFGVPAEFGISEKTAQILAGLFILIYTAVLIPLSAGKRMGLLGALLMGVFLALAGILKHIPLMVLPGPYWSGPFSEGLIIAMIVSGLACSLAAALALRSKNYPEL